MTVKYPELENYKTVDLPLDVIYFDREFNCRGVFTPQSCIELSESIRAHGLKIPIIVQPWQDGKYRIVAGHRRYTAVKYLLSWRSMPATIITGLMEADARLLNLLENLERKNLTLMEEARALRKNYPEDASQIQIARDLSKSASWVRMRWRILDMPQSVQDKIEQGILNCRDLTILCYKTPEEQALIAAQLAEAKARGVSSRQFFKTRRAKSIKVIEKMINELTERGLEPHPYDTLAWAAGLLTDEELLA
jgi:ParB family chromosome partitioning protein